MYVLCKYKVFRNWDLKQFCNCIYDVNLRLLTMQTYACLVCFNRFKLIKNNCILHPSDTKNIKEVSTSSFKNSSIQMNI